jgi:YesN/AraC family two-component response regulator
MDICTIDYSIGSAFFPQHKHNAYQFIFVKNGGASINMCAATFEISAPAIIFINSLESHSIQSKDPHYERYNITIDPKYVHQKITHTTLLSVFSCFRTANRFHLALSKELADNIGALLKMLGSSLDRSHKNTDTQCFDEAEQVVLLSAILYQIYHEAPDLFLNDEDKITKTIREIKSIIEQNPQNELSLEQLAKEHYFSTYYLAHSFKKLTGYGIKQYILLCRISLARELLQNSAVSISDICVQIGFGNMSNFSRYFKKEIGISPSEYRAKYQKTREEL